GGDAEKAVAAFHATRALALRGLPDPLGLAVASYGEEAKLHLDLAKASLARDPAAAAALAIYGREIAAAVALYAEEAAHGSKIAADSVGDVARLLLDNPSGLAASVADATVQRLVVAYVLARIGPAPEQTGYDAPTKQGGPDPVLVTVVDAIERQGLDRVAGAD